MKNNQYYQSTFRWH